MTVDITTLWGMIDKGGLIAFSIFIVAAFIKGWIVPRYVYDREVELRIFMQSAAMRGTELSERLTRVAESKVKDRD